MTKKFVDFPIYGKPTIPGDAFTHNFNFSRNVTAGGDNDQGNFRGYHAFLETTLDDGTQYLTDPTWYDAGPVNVLNPLLTPLV